MSVLGTKAAWIPYLKGAIGASVVAAFIFIGFLILTLYQDHQALRATVNFLNTYGSRIVALPAPPK